MNYTANKLPQELRANCKTRGKTSPVIEHLKVASALKLWVDRGFRDVRFNAPLAAGGKAVFVKVLARNAEGGVVGVECASSLKLARLRKRIARLRGSLPAGSWLVIVFPSGVGEHVTEVVKLADEVWIVGKNGTVECMMFKSVFHKE